MKIAIPCRMADHCFNIKEIMRLTCLYKYWLIAAFLIPVTQTAIAQKPVVTGLTCNYKTNPVGIGTIQPHLSWVITSTGYNIKQQAFRVIVSDNSRSIQEGKGDIWDSGKTASEESIQFKYNGPPLKQSVKYYWRVKVWDNKGNASDWSSIATWQMGLLSLSGWNPASWIAFDEIPESQKIIPAAHLGGKPEWGKLLDTLPLLRKAFNVKKPLEMATVFISGLGHFELSINGKKAGDHFLDPGWTLYNKHALYAAFDVTGMIKKESNAIGVMLGNGFYHVPADRYRKITGTYGHPKMICKLVLVYKDGTKDSIVSDQSWKASPGPVTFSSIFGGEDYDARLEQKGWDSPGFNDNAWKPAIIVDGPPVLEAQEAEPLKEIQTFTAVKITSPKPGVYVYDLGQNFSGIPAITVSGERGKEIKMVPGEILDTNGFVSQRPSGGPTYFTYTLSGEGKESWKPGFTYYGFRYIQVEGGVPQDRPNNLQLPVLHSITGIHTRNAAKQVGSFSCSDTLFNDIFKLIDWSIRSNLASALTDCPHREKLGWLEVPHLLGNSVRYNYNIASLYRKIIRDMQVSQTENGLVPNIAPEFVQFDPDFRDSPEWGSSAVILPYYVYKWYGDKEILQESYEMMKRYVDYLGSKAKDHIVSHGLGDWFDIGPNGSGEGYSVSTPQGITGTAMYYHDLQIMAKTASLLGKDPDISLYRSLSEKVKYAFNKKFYNSDSGYYGTNNQTANAMALYMGLVNTENKKAVLENLKTGIRKNGNRLTSGEVGFKHLLAVLEKEGESQLIYEMNNRSDVPGYGYQIAHGATTLMEDWQANKNLGNNHCMLGHLLSWLYGGLAGIQQDDSALAFKKIIIAPEPVGNIKAVNASYISPYGTIKSNWTITGEQFTIDISIPVNTDAVVQLPGTQESVIHINNRRINKGECRALSNNKIAIAIGSGDYKIIMKR